MGKRLDPAPALRVSMRLPAGLTRQDDHGPRAGSTSELGLTGGSIRFFSTRAWGFWSVWVQQYDPLGNWPLSTMAAGLPVLVLLGLLATGRVEAWKAALAGLVTASLVALAVFRMPVEMVLSSVAVGAVFATIRII